MPSSIQNKFKKITVKRKRKRETFTKDDQMDDVDDEELSLCSDSESSEESIKSNKFDDEE